MYQNDTLLQCKHVSIPGAWEYFLGVRRQNLQNLTGEVAALERCELQFLEFFGFVAVDSALIYRMNGQWNIGWYT